MSVFLYIVHKHFHCQIITSQENVGMLHLFNSTTKMLMFPFIYEYFQQVGNILVPTISLWYYASPVGLCMQSAWLQRIIYACRGQIYAIYRKLIIATRVWLTQSHKSTIPSSYGSSTCFLAMTSLFSSSIRLAAACQFFRIEQFGAIIPHFVLPSVPRLPIEPSSSETSFQNSFWDSVVQHPYYMPSWMQSFNLHIPVHFLCTICTVLHCTVGSRRHYQVGLLVQIFCEWFAMDKQHYRLRDLSFLKDVLKIQVSWDHETAEDFNVLLCRPVQKLFSNDSVF